MYSKYDIIEMLKFEGKDQENLFKEARKIREEVFEKKVILRGVVEITNLCRLNCKYCPMRKENRNINSLFMMNTEEIVNIAKKINELDINVVFLQGGETPQTTFVVGESIPKIKKLFNYNVEILLCLGIKSFNEYRYLKEIGADSYIMKHETSDPELHKWLRNQTFQYRLHHIKLLLEAGYKVGIGTIVGLPKQSLESIAEDILLAKELDVQMSSASPFISAPNTPLKIFPSGSLKLTLNTIAIMRIANPNWLIPSVSALEKLEKGGQLKGLEAGANVLTINFTPNKKRENYLIYGKERFIVDKHHVESLLKKSDLIPSKSIFI